MTRRVIQTDLFAAFKDSQRRAEEQVGQKKQIRVEGSTVRRVAAQTVKGERGLELIHSTPADVVGTAVAEPATPITTPTAETAPTVTETPEPTTPEAPVQPRPTVTYREAAMRQASTVDRKTVERPRPTAVTAAEPVQQPAPAATAAPTTPASGDDGGTLLKWATVILMIAAAFIIGQRVGEDQAKGRERVVFLTDPNDTTQPEEPVVTTPLDEELPVEIEPLQEEEPTVVPEATPPVAEEPVVPAQPLGNKTIMIVSGISKRQAEKVAELVRSQSEYPVYVRNDAVYVGRFENFYGADINACEEFCRKLEFEGRKQFRDAYQIKLPGSLVD